MFRVASSRLAQSLFPVRCPGCGREGEPACAECIGLVERAPQLAPPLGIDQWIAPYAYDGVVRDIVARVKYRNQRHALEWLGAEISRAGANACRRAEVEVVTWIPTTRAHRRARGFDHAELLAHEVARGLGLPCRRLLFRVDDLAQTGRSAAQRHHGPEIGAFQDASRARIAIVDDVATTGATLRAAAYSLRVAGATSVLALTAARTSPTRRKPRD